MERFFIFSTSSVNGYNETVYLNNDGIFVQKIDKECLMLFESKDEAKKYIEEKQFDLADYDKMSNF